MHLTILYVFFKENHLVYLYCVRIIIVGSPLWDQFGCNICEKDAGLEGEEENKKIAD